jgi:ketosteroid isomerase-like protein
MAASDPPDYAAESLTLVPTQVPITGKEEFGDVHTPKQAIIKFYRAFSTGDNSLMDQCWDTEVAVSNLNQLGGIIRDRETVLQRYTFIFKSSLKIELVFTDYAIQINGDWALAVGRESGSFMSNGERVPFLTRDTRLFRRNESGEWRHVHHHGSFENGSVLTQFQLAAGITNAVSG